MCGIFGYSGSKNALPILISSLYSLEYRGYDSSGVSVNDNGKIITVKSKGRISETERILNENYSHLNSVCGIGHTRWATHGEPSSINSHPHTTEKISLVHNGIIENYAELKEGLINKGVNFISQTDTEVALHLISEKYENTDNPVDAIREATKELSGSYAFGILISDFPGKIFAAKKDSPLIVAKSEIGSFIASDITAVLKYTNKIMRLSDGDIAEIDRENITIYDKSGKKTTRDIEEIEWGFEQSEKSGFPHFMLKEIFEEPEAVLKTVSPRVRDSLPFFDISGELSRRIIKCRKIHIVACGTAMHAGLLGKYFIEKYLRKCVNVEIASEFRYKNPILEKDDIFIALSQSGETADTLASLRLAKDKGLYTLSIVNVLGSTLARESDDVIYTYAGPEIAVASTKAYTVQASVMYLLTMEFARICNSLNKEKIAECVKTLIHDVPKALNKALELSDDIQKSCEYLTKQNSIFFIGRGMDSYLAQEASLKLKEIAYINCEAYPAGELKHGTISLISSGTPVVAIITEKELFPKMLSNIKEVRARGAYVTVICDNALDFPVNECDRIIRVPHLDNSLTCVCASTAFQLLAYHTANCLGCDIDKPRNLAKSVTVE